MMDGWLVESWNGAVASCSCSCRFGEGGLVAGHAGRPGHLVPGHLGVWARTRHNETKCGRKPPAVVTVG